MTDRPELPRPVHRDAKFGTSSTVAWITGQTVPGLSITSAIPPVFEAYATIVEMEPWTESSSAAQDRTIVEHLQAVGPDRWWLGYLDTGSSDVVFPSSQRIDLYANWPYVIVAGDAAAALGWRDELPDLIFPEDRSWLVSTLWDDGWRCVGGTNQLIEALTDDPLVRARQVRLEEEDATPPGHIAI